MPISLRSHRWLSIRSQKMGRWHNLLRRNTFGVFFVWQITVVGETYRWVFGFGGFSGWFILSVDYYIYIYIYMWTTGYITTHLQDRNFPVNSKIQGDKQWQRHNFQIVSYFCKTASFFCGWFSRFQIMFYKTPSQPRWKNSHLTHWVAPPFFRPAFLFCRVKFAFFSLANFSHRYGLGNSKSKTDSLGRVTDSKGGVLLVVKKPFNRFGKHFCENHPFMKVEDGRGIYCIL